MRYIIKESTLTDLADAIRYKAGIEEMLSPNEMVDVIDGLTTTTERPFNFEIVGGTTEPVNPADNTIWINTGVTIGEWQLAYSEPATRTDGNKLAAGDVWLLLSTKSNVSISLSRKFYIQACIIGAYQWDGSVWIPCEFAGYVDGEWKTTVLLYYSPTDGVYGGDWLFSRSDTSNKTTERINVYADHDPIDISIAIGLTPIDVTNLTTVYINISAFARSSDSATRNYVGLTDNRTDVTTDGLFYIKSDPIENAQLVSLDVSTMTGLYYPKIQAYNHSETSGTKSYITVDKIYAE